MPASRAWADGPHVERVARVAALYDVHGNLPALEAVLAEAADADLLLFGGDIVSGPLPAETLALVRSLGERARCIRGNADRRLDAENGVVQGISEETVAELPADDLRFLERLPERDVVDVEGVGAVLFCHASPRNDVDIFTSLTPDEHVRPLLDGVRERLVVCGHTHVQFDRVVAGIRIVNAGSVGMAYEDRPGAYWALLGPDVELRRTEYDVEEAAARIRRSKHPDADAWIEAYLVNRPSAREATEYFEQFAVGRE